MKRYLTIDNLRNTVWRVDGSCGVHWDSKGHTGAMLLMGKGAIVNISRKHKMNVGSSTESELVSIADVLGMILWCKYFMEAQGYTIESNMLYQDNKSTILLAKNGRMSAGKNSKHIKNRVFLITDKVAQGDVEIKHIGTKTMWADINTKPVQGRLFRVFRHKMTGVPVDYDDDVERRNTHPLLLPKIETARVSQADGDLLEKAAVVKKVTNPVATAIKAEAAPKRGTLGGPFEKTESARKQTFEEFLRLSKSGVALKKGSRQGPVIKSIPPKKTISLAKRRSVLGDPKYGSGSVPHWKAGGSRYPALFKALTEEPCRIKKRQLLLDSEVSVSSKEGANVRMQQRCRNQ